MSKELELVWKKLKNMIDKEYAELEDETDRYKICTIVGLQRSQRIVESVLWNEDSNEA